MPQFKHLVDFEQHWLVPVMINCTVFLNYWTSRGCIWSPNLQVRLHVILTTMILPLVLPNFFKFTMELLFNIRIKWFSARSLWFLTFWRFFQFYFCFNPTPNLAFVNSKIHNGFDYSIFCIAKWQLSVMFCDTTFKFPVLTFSRCRRTSCSLHC